MGGKTSTSQSTVSVPPQVLAQYESVNATAEQAASKPFQTYSGEFVAPVNQTQLQGIAGTNAAANEAQPYYGAATGVLGATQAGTQPVNTAAEIGTAENAAPISGADIEQYLSPYLGTVMSSTEALQNISNQQQQAGQLGNAITSGAFGSDRTGIAAANLAQQQQLANENVLAGIANTGYNTALGTATTEQQAGLAGAAQLAGIGQTAYGEGANTATTLAGLGSGAQSAALTGAEAQIAAGTVQQQTQQAQDTALYNQFLQEQSYPFQTAQLLADIAEGTGSLSGSTTTTTQPGGFFSDRRLKRDIQKIGKTFDGQDVVTYKMGNDNRTRIGLIAQDVEKKHPHAVGLAGGFKVVDYGKATEEAANKGHFRTGGVVVPFRRIHRDTGGGLAGVLRAQQQMYAAMPGAAQARQINTGTGGGGRSLAVANAPASPPPSGASELNQSIGLANNGYKAYRNFTAPSGVAPSASSSIPEAGASDADMLGAYGATPAASSAPAAAAPAAADAAATAAAPAAADAAGTAAAGAVGTAAAGAGTEAAADAAAALAAEYAAADVGAAAILAAKRGGAIRRGYDAGGMPYSVAAPYSDSGDINIPDEQNTNTLKAAPAAGKQPTGFQNLLYMGNPENTSTLLGSTFSNEALATGGVAGRRRFDGGGGATDDDSDDTEAPAPPPAAPADSTTGGGLAGWWGRNKGTVIPILEGIGAGMTAPTSHAGVAIAAGLEAAAKGYAPAQEQLAEAQLIQAQAQGRQLENVPLGVKARIAQSIPTGGVAPPQPSATVNPAPAIIAASPTATTYPLPDPIARTAGAPPAVSGPSQVSSAQSPSDAAQSAAGLAAQYRSRFFVNTARTPEEQAQKDAAIQKDWAVGGTMFSQQADNDYKARVQRDQQNARNTAQQLADAQYAQATDPTVSPAARAAALARYNALRQWTGDGTEIKGGIVRNTRTNQPEIGTMAQQGLTPEQAAQLKIEMASPVDTGAPAREPLSAWAASHGITLPSTEVGAPPIGTPPGATAAPGPGAGRPPPVAPPKSAAAQDFSSAPPAPAWATDPSVVPPAGQDPKAYAQIQNNLIAEAGGLEGTQADIIKTQRMLNLLPNAKTGPGSDMMAMTQTVLGNLTGSQFVSWLDSNPSAYAILQKSLGQQALDKRLREMRSDGATVRLGAMQDNLILNKLSASPEMPKSAIEGILNWQLQQDNWDLKRQTAIPQYLAEGRDARYFDALYPKQNPLAQSLTTGAPTGTTVSRAPIAVTSQAQYDALPRGASYQWNGRTLVKQ